MKRKGFTLFELLAVLTIIGISLTILLGAYGSWGTVHALNGATSVLEAGLAQARTLAMTQNAYVAFDYRSFEPNSVQTVTGFQIRLCTNENAEVAAVLQNLSTTPVALDLSQTIPAVPYQRLSGHVRLGHVTEADMDTPSPQTASGVTFFFRPDGSAWSWDDIRTHYLCVYTQDRFARGGNGKTEPLRRYLSIDLATGLVTVLKEEVTP